MEEPLRKILHVDMDAFYAAVEQRDDPSLRGKPICVGGDPSGRGVVTTCSYEARKFGIHSAMAAAQAKKLCPHAVFVRPRFEAYREASQKIHEVFYEYTELVQPVSLDEAYLDVSHREEAATVLAREIKKKIKERTGLTASAGVSYNKFLAKIASDFNKPNGLTVITPEMAQALLDDMPIRKFQGIGKVTEARMKKLGIETGYDLRKKTKAQLVSAFGSHGKYFYYIARGIDDRPVHGHHQRKSLGKEKTLKRDVDDRLEMMEVLWKLANRIQELMSERNLKGRTVNLKVKYSDFEVVTRAITLPEPINDAPTIIMHVERLLDKTEAGQRKVRLLGISISQLDTLENGQTRLF